MPNNRDRCVCIKRSYAVEIEEGQFKNLLEWLKNQKNEAPNYCALANSMQAAVPGIHSIHISEHFKNFVYFDLDANDDTKRNRARIIEVIDITMGFVGELKPASP